MKKLLALIIVAAVVGLATGCASLFTATKDKGVNVSTSGLGVVADSGASTTGTIMPRVVFGSVTLIYQSLPEGTKNGRVYYSNQSGSWFAPSTIKDATVSYIETSETPLAAPVETTLTEKAKK